MSLYGKILIPYLHPPDVWASDGSHKGSLNQDVPVGNVNETVNK